MTVQSLSVEHGAELAPNVPLHLSQAHPYAK